MFRITSGIFLGWALGANDSANVFGTAVSSKMIKYKIAIILTAVFVVLGAVLQGREGMHTLKGLTTQTIQTAFIASLGAAITVTLLTILKLPISTSQAVVGSIIGIGIMIKDVSTSGLLKVVICWIATPIGGMATAIILYFFFKFLFIIFKPNVFISNSLIKIGLTLAGCYGAYALGANNTANVTGFYVGNLLNEWQAVLIGGGAIALGAVTFSFRVMKTVGKSIVKLDGFTAFIAVLAHAVTVYIYALIGVPVSTSQAIVGAVVGIGLIKGLQTVKFKTLGKIGLGWLMTPVLSCGITIFIYALFN